MAIAISLNPRLHVHRVLIISSDNILLSESVIDDFLLPNSCLHLSGPSWFTLLNFMQLFDICPNIFAIKVSYANYSKVLLKSICSLLLLTHILYRAFSLPELKKKVDTLIVIITTCICTQSEPCTYLIRSNHHSFVQNSGKISEYLTVLTWKW